MLCMGMASNSEFANIYFVNFVIPPICKNKVKYKFPGIRIFQVLKSVMKRRVCMIDH